MTDLALLAPDFWTVHCDGSAVPNPGRMGFGVVMTDPAGQRHAFSHATHAIGCNNEAELRALMAGLEALKSRGVTRLCAYSDNSVLVAQLTDARSQPIARLAALFDEARALLSSFEQASLRWIPRHRNVEADALARAAMGLPLKPLAKPSKRKR
ncbi:MAG: ribonuclease HI family protein [Aquabacterium sp.]|uniref:ribonuclease HI family protein n=1 Tax=Aquabacterium sp. TaxID=1872578 RepID=UPI00272636A1|nr:ribonuclease HI family protein [Aquabacterium sp.]MDO9005629.1 ribonuclease HI family protein [Aquabacterium sp.]